MRESDPSVRLVLYQDGCRIDVGSDSGGSVAGARAAILAHLADGIPRTFNCIAIQLTGYTADALVGAPIEGALWALCEDGALAWACEDDVVFWTLSSMVEWNDEGRAAA